MSLDCCVALPRGAMGLSAALIVVFPDHTHYLLLLYQLLHVWVLRTGFGLCCATYWSLLMLFLPKAVPVPGDKIPLPLYESTVSCGSLLQVEWQPDLSPQQTIFSHDYCRQVDIM